MAWLLESHTPAEATVLCGCVWLLTHHHPILALTLSPCGLVGSLTAYFPRVGGEARLGILPSSQPYLLEIPYLWFPGTPGARGPT